MVIQHNISSMFTERQLNIVDGSRADSSEKLSTGYRINRSADDAAGLSISEKLRYQIRGLETASNNIATGINLVKVADGALNESHAILQRMNELAVQAANDTNTEVDRGAIQFEIDDLVEELDRIANTTTFNEGIYPLNSSGSIGKLPDSLTTISLNIENDTNANIEYNGKIYKPNETITVSNLLWFTDSSMYNTRVFLNYHSTHGSGNTPLAGWYPIDAVNTTNTIQNIFYSQQFGPDIAYIFYTLTPNDLKEDENGYLYVTDPTPSPSSDVRLYFRNGGLLTVPAPDGSDNKSPSIADAEAAGCLKRLPNGSIPGTVGDLIKIQAGHLAGQTIDIPLVNATAKSLGVENLDVMTHTYASKSLPIIQEAINKVSSYRSTFGSCQNRLEHAMRNVDNTGENSQAAESRIRDTDVTSEMVKLSAANIISQAATSMLTQANKMSDSVLRLLE